MDQSGVSHGSAPAESAPQTLPDPQVPENPANRVRRRHPRRHYNCGPCRKQKIKCDTNIPCGTCKRYNRVQACLDAPANPLQPSEKERKKQRASQQRKPTPVEPEHQSGHPLRLQSVHSLVGSLPHDCSARALPSTAVAQPAVSGMPPYPAPQHATPIKPVAQSLPYSAPQPPPPPPPPPHPPQHRTIATTPSDTPQLAPLVASLPTFQPANPTPRLSASRIPSIQFSGGATSSSSITASSGSSCTFPSPSTAVSTATEPPSEQSDPNTSDNGAATRFYPSEPHSHGHSHAHLHVRDLYNFVDASVNWQMALPQLLPSRAVVDCLTTYYFTTLDYIYRPLHGAVFHSEISRFYDSLAASGPSGVDLGWLAQLFAVLGTATVHLPREMGPQLGFSSATAARLGDVWFNATRQALAADRYMEKPRFEHVQTFCVLQLLLYSTNRTEQMKSMCAVAVALVHALGLHCRDSGAAENKPFTTEMRRRVWWDVAGCDNFLALCLGRPALARAYLSDVPLPANVNDHQLNPETDKPVVSLPVAVPTDACFNRFRARLMMIVNGVFELPKTNDQTVVFQGLLALDKEMEQLSESAPWFFRLCGAAGGFADVPGEYMAGHGEEFEVNLRFQHHMAHSSMCIQRFRLYQQYLHMNVPIAWKVCLPVAKAMFAVYKQLRARYELSCNQYLATIHQGFAGSVIQAMLLLQENIHPSDAAELFWDVEMMLGDLRQLADRFLVVPETVRTSLKVAEALREMYVRKREKEGMAFPPEAPSSSLVSSVASVFGGKNVTETYLERCTIDYLVNGSEAGEQQKTEDRKPKVGDVSGPTMAYPNGAGTETRAETRVEAAADCSSLPGELKSPSSGTAEYLTNAGFSVEELEKSFQQVRQFQDHKEVNPPELDWDLVGMDNEEYRELLGNGYLGYHTRLLTYGVACKMFIQDKVNV